MKMRRSKGDDDDDDDNNHHKASSSRKRGDQRRDKDHDGSCSGNLPEDDNDPVNRREIRSKYRDLINTVQQNREDMLNPSNNKLTEVLEEANKLFKDVRQAREAALDAQFLVVATDLGKEKASQLFAEGVSFDPSAFAEHLVSVYQECQIFTEQQVTKPLKKNKQLVTEAKTQDWEEFIDEDYWSASKKFCGKALRWTSTSSVWMLWDCLG